MEGTFTREAAERWMLNAVNDGLHMEHGEVNMTSLAEGCADHFDVADEEGSPLDDPDHWIWEVALAIHDRNEEARA